MTITLQLVMDEPSCTGCGAQRADPLEWKCKGCGWPFSFEDTVFERSKVVASDSTIWRYSEFLPKGLDRVTMGEGMTPLVRIMDNVYLKCDYVMPTGSFKDRGSSVLVSHAKNLLKEKEIKYLVEDSSGNAGASVAAYCARASLDCRVYVPATAKGQKMSQIKAYGASISKVKGNREDVARAAQRASKKAFFASHSYSPYFIEGVKTVAYEVVEQLGWRVPDAVYLPVSAGTLLLGVLKGFREVGNGGLGMMPKVKAVQVENVSPLYHAFLDKPYKPPKNPRTLADGLVSTNPPRLAQMVKELKDAKGDVSTVNESEIRLSTKELAKAGFYVEPSSGVAYAALKRDLSEGKLSKDDIVVLILTGSGLKSWVK